MTQEFSDESRELLEELELKGILNDEIKVLTFCCACCSLIWDKLPKIAQDALNVSEKYMKNCASEKDLEEVRLSLWNSVYKDYSIIDNTDFAPVNAALCCLKPIKNQDQAFDSMLYVMDFCNYITDKSKEQYHLLTEIFNN